MLDISHLSIVLLHCNSHNVVTLYNVSCYNVVIIVMRTVSLEKAISFKFFLLCFKFRVFEIRNPTRKEK